ncbi:MAG: dodecin domain-containing protein, partial [Planctomycetaceae bacterium]|nr:dodecin domain-containing protein [Planctomycetaceae bacterium]
MSRPSRIPPRKELTMPESVYKVIELVGTSSESWEKAAAAATKQA